MSIATELTALSGHITNAYNAVNAKGGAIPANKNMANLDDAILSIPTSRTITNGIIEQYKASANTIAADTFVEFVNGNLTKRSSATAGFTVNYLRDWSWLAVKVSDDTVFVLFCSNGTYKYLYGAIVHVSSGTVSIGAQTQITPDPYVGHYADLCLLSNNRVFVVYSYESTSGNTNGGTAYGVICTITNNTITAGTPTQLASFTYSGQNVTATAINDNDVFVGVQGGGTVMVCNTSGNVITPGTATQILDAGGDSTSAMIAPNKALIFYGSGYAAVCSISGTSITVESTTSSRVKRLYNERNWLTPLGSGKAILTYVSNTSPSTPHAALIEIDDNNVVTASSDIVLTEGSYIRYSVADNTNGIVECFMRNYNSSSSDDIFEIVRVGLVNGSLAILSREAIPTTGTGTSAFCAIKNGADDYIVITATYTNAYTIYADYVAPGKTIQASQTKIDGLTAEEITTSTAGDVWVLDTGA